MENHFFERAKIMFIKDEGIRYKPYRCPAGKLTIGIGHNLDDNEMPQKTIFQLLEGDVEIASKAIERIYGQDIVTSLSEERKLALINLAFNLGELGLSKFVTFNSLIKAKRYSEAADRLLKTKYATQVKGRAQRVASMIRNNDFPYT